MLRNALFMATVAAIVAPVVLTTDVIAGSSTSPKTGRQHARLVAHSVPQYRDQHAAHRAFARGAGNGSAGHYTVPPDISLFNGPGYVNAPRLCAAQGICD
jgi:hypothetical protein